MVVVEFRCVFHDSMSRRRRLSFDEWWAFCVGLFIRFCFDFDALMRFAWHAMYFRRISFASSEVKGRLAWHGTDTLSIL
jgi:hypothetical protein